jgi:rhodanese-related sulfurtransferase
MLKRVLVIIAAGMLMGFAWNQWSGRGFELRANALVLPGDEEIKPAEGKKRLEQGALFLDVRPAINYELGHIPGALSYPLEKFDAMFPAMEVKLRDSMDIVVYCAGFGCDASHEMSRKLKAKGIPAVILQEGWPAWKEAGYPTKEGKTP